MAEYQSNASITERHDLSDELIVLRIKPDYHPFADFEPGQYAEIALIQPGEIVSKIERRQYSIASARGDERGLEFYIVLVPGGLLTPSLWQLNLGDRVWINPKVKGKFTLEPVPPGKDLVLISTGTGLAPFMSMLRTYRSSGRWRKLVVVHGARFMKDLGYRDELEECVRRDPSVFYLSTTTREPEGSAWLGHRGRVQTLLQDGTYERVVGSPFTPEDCQVFLCGNPQMIDETEAWLVSRGFKEHRKKDAGNIHIERYW